jgi:tRNA dimethylallyltransferase
MDTQNNVPCVLIITGPTAVGKTDFALEIARYLPAEIVNADMGQLYTPLAIGTAKPDWKTFTIKHHLFDLIDGPENFTVMRYYQQATATILDIARRGKIAIVVGGSGFYVKSLLFPPRQIQGIVELAMSGTTQEL